MPKSVEWSMSTKQLAAFEQRLARYEGLPMQRRVAKGTLAAAQYLAKPIKAGAPVGPARDGHRGALKKSVRARQGSQRGNVRAKTLQAIVGPTVPYRHLVIRGHRIVTRLGRDTGQRSTPNPFVDKAVAGHTDEAVRIVSRALFGK